MSQRECAIINFFPSSHTHFLLRNSFLNAPRDSSWNLVSLGHSHSQVRVRSVFGTGCWWIGVWHPTLVACCRKNQGSSLAKDEALSCGDQSRLGQRAGSLSLVLGCDALL